MAVAFRRWLLAVAFCLSARSRHRLVRRGPPSRHIRPPPIRPAGQMCARRNIFSEQYTHILRCASASPSSLQLAEAAKQQFEKAYGVTWEAALGANEVMSAAEASEKLGLSHAELFEARGAARGVASWRGGEGGGGESSAPPLHDGGAQRDALAAHMRKQQEQPRRDDEAASRVTTEIRFVSRVGRNPLRSAQHETDTPNSGLHTPRLILGDRGKPGTAHSNSTIHALKTLSQYCRGTWLGRRDGPQDASADTSQKFQIYLQGLLAFGRF